MNRSIIVCIVIALAAVSAPKAAFADETAPTKEQLDQAKKAFGEGKALFDEGKLNEAIDKFKESYRLSRNPLLLYNIGFTLDQAGAKDKALFYYRKFLADAPKAATQRKEVEKRVDVIEKENLEADLAGTTTTTTPTNTNTTTTTKPVAEVKPTVTVKPAGTYTATDFQHQMIDAAPPGKPLDVTAFVPEDSGWNVTLYYRGNGDTKFFARTMRWRYKELVARIPAMKVGGSTIQYYIEAKDSTGAVVAKSGKSTSPNLINVDTTVAPRFYPDFTDEGEAPVQTAVQVKHHDEEDPLNKGGSSQVVDDEPNGGGGTTVVGGGVNETPTAGGNGFSDVGSSKFSKAKWASTGVAGAGLAAAMVGYILAKKQADNLVADSKDCPMGMTPPCRAFDLDYDKAVEDAGHRYNTIHTVGVVVGVGAGVVAAYFWYRQLTAKKHGELKVSKSGGSPETVWAITPSVTDGFTGAAAAARF